MSLELILTVLFAALAAVHIVAIAIFLLPARRMGKSTYTPPVSIIIPAHNEARFIAATIQSILNADYPSKKEVLVIDDGSSDETAEIVKALSRKNKAVRLFSIPHSGKAKALNYGLEKARFETVVCMDADSSIEKQSLLALVQPLADPKTGASSGAIRVKYNGLFTWFQDIDYIVSSGWRHICSKLNSTYVTPGFAAFKKSALEKIHGFSNDTLTEDIDVTIRLRKAGFHAVMSRAVIHTAAPSSLTGLVKQRIRWGRGSMQVAKKHSDILFSRSLNFIGNYAFPMHLFWYAFALMYIPFAVYWFVGNFISQPLSLASVELLAKWFTIYGIADVVVNILTGAYALTALMSAIILSWLFSFLYLLLNMARFGFTWRTLVAYLFIFPYYWLLLAVQAVVLVAESSSSKRVTNKWNKNEGNVVE
ncbi:MAG: glycosyltransferase family 2 protein [Candidatus Aenigmarchaeota archaeon]|nr:glycosyltransferase family 2 protein [Candidatus Aenigmarchaeota archaeon]